MDDKKQRKYGHMLGNVLAGLITICIMAVVLTLTIKFIFWLL